MPATNQHFWKARNPDRLLRLILVVALVATIGILALAGYSYRRVYEWHVIQGAKDNSIDISGALLTMGKEQLYTRTATGEALLAITSEKAAELDQNLRRFLHPLHIVKIKVFTPDGTIIYSTDPTIVGQIDNNNQSLKQALSGTTNAKLGRKEKVIDLADEQKFNVDVVETYVPLRAGNGSIIGSFEIYMDVTRYRTEIEDGVLHSVGLLALILLSVFVFSLTGVRRWINQLKQTQSQLQKMATIDDLTGVFNRREILVRAEAAFELIKSENNRRKTNDSSLGIIMIDIDKFKNINDRYGHPVGDEVLKEFPDRIATAVRDHDFVGRYGGEEFLVVLPGSNLKGTQVIAERIREQVKADPFVRDSLNLWVTISLGIAVASDQLDLLDKVIKHADDGLYQAKHDGRDQVGCIPSPLEEQPVKVSATELKKLSCSNKGMKKNRKTTCSLQLESHQRQSLHRPLDAKLARCSRMKRRYRAYRCKWILHKCPRFNA